MALRVYIDAILPPEADVIVREGLAGHELVRASRPTGSNLVAAGPDPAMAEADVWFGQPSVGALASASRLRWIHLTSAGYTRYAIDAVRDALTSKGVALTTSSTVYAEPCATHALALVLALLRRLPEALRDQDGARGWPSARLRASSGILAERRVLVLGFGAIARRLVTLLEPFGCPVKVLRSRRRGDEPVHVVTWDELGEMLPVSDVVLSTLPESPETRGVVDGTFFDRLPEGALFVNVGRGTTVDQAALLHALESGRLGGAGLDVTDPEPLPREHPLWSHPSCLITPHAAGGRDTEFLAIARHFVANVMRFTKGEPLHDRVT